MNKKKLILGLIAIIAIVAMVGGILAYFTKTTATLTNTFTVGENVNISLTEPNWNSAYAQGLSFGNTVAKDPTVTNTGSNNAYVFVKVDVPVYYKYVEEEGVGKGKKFEMFTYSLNSGWYELESLKTENADSITHIYAYGNASAMTALAPAAGETPAGTATLFNSVTFLDGFTYSSNYNVVSKPLNEEIPTGTQTTADPALVQGSSNINVTAYAIQTNGLRQGNTTNAAVTPAEVYACLYGELPSAGLVNPNP